MMHVSVMMLSYAALMVGSLWRSHFLSSLAVRTLNFEAVLLALAAIAKRLSLTVHTDGSTPSSAEQSAMARLIENNGNGKTAVLDVVTASHLKR